MQEMTSEVCASTATGVSAQLKDVRDNKYYWVTKLADGKCWMTQNLDLDLNASYPSCAGDFRCFLKLDTKQRSMGAGWRWRRACLYS